MPDVLEVKLSTEALESTKDANPKGDQDHSITKAAISREESSTGLQTRFITMHGKIKHQNDN